MLPVQHETIQERFACGKLCLIPVSERTEMALVILVDGQCREIDGVKQPC